MPIDNKYLQLVKDADILLPGYLRGFTDALAIVLYSLRDYPTVGGDILIMAEIDRIVTEAKKSAS